MGPFSVSTTFQRYLSQVYSSVVSPKWTLVDYFSRTFSLPLPRRSWLRCTVFFSFIRTFFGGGDDSWATPVDTHTYFRNFQLWGSSSPSELSGDQVRNAAAPNRTMEWGWIIVVAVLAFFCGLELV